jgi:hypothetical protein
MKAKQACEYVTKKNPGLRLKALFIAAGVHEYASHDEHVRRETCD